MTNRTIVIMAGIVALVVILATGWYFISPLFINRSVDEALPSSISIETSRPPTTTAVESQSDVLPDKTMDEAMPEEEQVSSLLSGQFIDADNFHRGSGKVSILELSEGSRILRMEDFFVTNGPDLHVLLAVGSKPTGKEDLGQYVDLGELKGNLGNQNYPIPDDIDLESFQSVVIYCVPFHVVFSTAHLSE